VIFGIDTVVDEWLSHGMPLPAPGGEGKLESRPTVTRLSLGCLMLSSIFNITLREEFLFSPKPKINHGSSFCFHGASRLSRAPWSEVEGHPFPGVEPTATLAQLHRELCSHASTTTK